jgi:large subunit ribosomal protein L43
MSNNLVTFAQQNPELTVRTELKRAVHPFVRGHYVNGNSKTIGIKNLSTDEVHNHVLHLRNQIGRRMNGKKGGYRKDTLTESPSIQGPWDEGMSMANIEYKIQYIPSSKTN